jgi:hypothetical protein
MSDSISLSEHKIIDIRSIQVTLWKESGAHARARTLSSAACAYCCGCRGAASGTRVGRGHGGYGEWVTTEDASGLGRLVEVKES